MTPTQQPEALNLEEFRAKVTRAAREPLLARIAELESQFSAIGAGGVEPLRKQAAAPQAVQAESKIGYLLALARIMVRTALDADNETEVQEIKAAIESEVAFERALRAALAATQPAAHGMDAQDAARWRHTLEHPAEEVPAQATRDAVIQHLTNAGVLEHDGCGIFIASGDASELIDACMALSTHAHHEKGAAAQAVALLATGGQAQAVERIAIDMKQTAELLDLFGGEPTEFTVMQCNGHSGPGLYAYVTEYPEDGASYLGKTDCEAQPAPQAQAVCGIANKELRTEHAMQLVDAWYEAMKCGSVITRGEARQRIVEFVDALAATHPTQQGLELANCKGGKWLTVVYHDIQPGYESRTIVEHPKVSALSWSHALHDRDAALAAQAKHGEAQQ